MTNEELFKKLEEYDKEVNKLFQENKKLKSIIDKAREYIEKHIKYECDGTYGELRFMSHHLYDNFKKEDLLKILKGEENDR